MSLRDVVGGLGLLRALVQALTRHNQLMEELIDEYRLARGDQPKYRTVQAPPTGFVAELLDEQDASVDEQLREHARRVGYPVDDLTDIRALAKQHGWVDREGQLQV